MIILPGILIVEMELTFAGISIAATCLAEIISIAVKFSGNIIVFK